MRELKFRAWDTFNGCFVYADMATLCDGPHPCDFRLTVNADQVAGVEQYTGIKDKNGKEVFEGDILGGAIGLTVHWCDNSNGFQLTDGEDCNCYRCSGDVELSDYNTEDIEVIGNIHENGDLLK